jgi:hypothetical protein
MARLDDVFEIIPGHSLTLNALKEIPSEQGVPFISRKTSANGVSAYVERLSEVEPRPGGELTCALNGDGGVMATFLQDRAYYTAFHVACLRPRNPLSTGELLYYCRCIWENHYRYGWGRQANRTLASVNVPALEEIPEWVRSVEVDEYAGASQPLISRLMKLRSPKNWGSYSISELFDVRKGKRLTKANMRSGTTPFIGAIDKNNGLSAWIDRPPLHRGNTITVNYNGSVAEAFYQQEPFWCSDDVNVLYPRFEMTAAIALFIASVIRLERYRFNYGRKWHLDRMRAATIRLPSTATGNPDWQYMDEFISTLPFSSQL